MAPNVPPLQCVNKTRHAHNFPAFPFATVRPGSHCANRLLLHIVQWRRLVTYITGAAKMRILSGAALYTKHAQIQPHRSIPLPAFILTLLFFPLFATAEGPRKPRALCFAGARLGCRGIAWHDCKGDLFFSPPHAVGENLLWRGSLSAKGWLRNVLRCIKQGQLWL